MPLKGTPREQKHYRRIRKEYPEKGKEYAARVARNIVRANTPGGRKLKGTTEYGRTWGPPYSEPLSKQSAFYTEGVSKALVQLGFEKEARYVVPGALLGGATGAIASDPGERITGGLLGAGLGGLMGGAGGWLGTIPKALRGRAAERAALTPDIAQKLEMAEIFKGTGQGASTVKADALRALKRGKENIMAEASGPRVLMEDLLPLVGVSAGGVGAGMLAKQEKPPLGERITRAL